MKLLKPVLLVLVAAGICGGLYFGLSAGMHLAASALVRPEAPVPATQAQQAAAAPVPEESAHDALERRLTDLGAGSASRVGSSDQPPAPPTALVPMPYRTWLPPPATGAQPRALPGETGRTPRAGPAVDVPPLADAGALVPAPTPVRLAATTPVPVASPDPALILVNSIAARPSTPEVAADPTAHAARATATAAVPPLREAPVPFLKLSIPDPSPLPGALEMSSPPPDEDPPVTPPGLPGRVTLSPTR